jgi:hypothetical protein
MNETKPRERHGEEPQDAGEMNPLGFGVDLLRNRLEACLRNGLPQPSVSDEALRHWRQQGGHELTSRLEHLAQTFHLTVFEQDVLWLCLAFEVDSAVRDLILRMGGGRGFGLPTFAVCFRLLEGAHWSAVFSGSPLRTERILELSQQGGALLDAGLQLDERLLEFILTGGGRDERLAAFVSLQVPEESWTRAQGDLAQQMASVLRQAHAEEPVFALDASWPGDASAVTMAFAHALSREVAWIAASSLPSAAEELDRLARAWSREAKLTGHILLLRHDANASGDAHGTVGESVPVSERRLMFLSRLRGCVVLEGACGKVPGRTVLRFVVKPRSAEEHRTLWSEELHGRVNAEGAARLAIQYPADVATVRAAAEIALAQTGEGSSTEEVERAAMQACRVQLRVADVPGAYRVEERASWDDLILPARSAALLREMVARMQLRATVLEDWGFATRQARGQGICAVFSGPSGTGKTTAAGVLARELGMDLLQVDLSATLSKYIGETEKHIAAVFEAAERSGAMLLFDEADSLFSKRMEVRDSHDRSANTQISFLLQKLEQFRGLAVLTTNLPQAIDTAFLRRVTYAISFPYPGIAEREHMWRRVFPPGVPVGNIDTTCLSQLTVSGASLRNIALSGAFLAAAEGSAVEYWHVLQAARSEFEKLGQPFPEMEVRSWY